MHADFADRSDAGRQLAAAVARLDLSGPVVVLALPRGGVVVAAEVARVLHAPLDLVLVRKIGAPGEPELAVAAIGEGEPPVLVIDERSARMTGADRAFIDRAAKHERAEIERRRQLYRGGRARVGVTGKTVVLVDDGIATGATVRAALRTLAIERPARLVLAVPVAPPDTLAELRPLVDDVVCLAQPEFFNAVGHFYRDFDQVDDTEVVALLERAGG